MGMKKKRKVSSIQNFNNSRKEKKQHRKPIETINLKKYTIENL